MLTSAAKRDKGAVCHLGASLQDTHRPSCVSPQPALLEPVKLTLVHPTVFGNPRGTLKYGIEVKSVDKSPTKSMSGDAAIASPQLVPVPTWPAAAVTVHPDAENKWQPHRSRACPH